MKVFHIILSGSALMVAGTAALAQAFPEDPNKALVQKTCTGCHVGTQVTSQRKTQAQWAETVDTMIGLGAPVSDADYDKIVKYLGTHFGPAGGTTAAPGTPPAKPN